MNKIIKLIFFLSLLKFIVFADFIFPGQRFNNNQECVVNTNGDIGNCVKFSECARQWDLNINRKDLNSCEIENCISKVCCPIKDKVLNGISVFSVQSENIKIPSISEKKCEQRYFPYAIPAGIGEGGVIEAFVVGGKPSKPGEFPYMAAIGWESSTNGTYNWDCGGFLIESKFVITAAHCAKSSGIPPRVVLLNTTNLNAPRNPGVEIPIAKITVHPKYNEQYDYNDIAIIELERETNIAPPCLWPNTTLKKDIATAIGYGHIAFGGPASPIQLKVSLLVYDNEYCGKFYSYTKSPGMPNGLEDSQLCAGDPERRKDTCQGDSGGPLMYKVPRRGQPVPYVVGIVSFGQACASEVPSVYTRISSHISWIESIVWPNEP